MQRQLLKMLTVSVLLIAVTNLPLLAQFEDEEDEYLQETSEDVCIPDTLLTAYDSVATKELTQDIRLLYNFGYEYYKNKTYKDALPYLWTVFIKDNDKYARSSIRKIAEIYFNQQMVDSTLLACYRGLERFPDIVRLHHYAGLLQNKVGKFRCAMPHYEKLIEKDSTNISYLKTLAFLYFKDGNERALTLQKRVVELAPDNAEEKDLLAEYSDHMLGKGASLKLREENYKNNPDNLEYAWEYGDAAVEAGEYEKAIEPLLKVVREKPTTKAYMRLALAYENLNRRKSAIEGYKEILKLTPKSADVMLMVAENYKFENNFSSSKFWINKTLNVKPNYGKAYILWGELIEATVSYCQKKRGSEKYEDKLVYEKAYGIYAKAKRDPAYRAMAKNKQNYLIPLMPTDEDRFMHKNAKIKSSCYKWLK